MIKTGVSQTCASCSLRIDFLEIFEHRFNRRMQAVQIHSVESDRRSLRIYIFIKTTQPLDELQYDCVAPHPCGKPAKTRERFIRIGVRSAAAHVTMNAG